MEGPSTRLVSSSAPDSRGDRPNLPAGLPCVSVSHIGGRYSRRLRSRRSSCVRVDGGGGGNRSVESTFRESRNGAAKLRSAETGVFRPHLTRCGTHVRLERAEASASRHRELCQTRSRRTARTGPRGRTTGADALTFRAQETADLEKFCKRAANGRNRSPTNRVPIDLATLVTDLVLRAQLHFAVHGHVQVKRVR